MKNKNIRTLLSLTITGMIVILNTSAAPVNIPTQAVTPGAPSMPQIQPAQSAPVAFSPAPIQPSEPPMHPTPPPIQPTEPPMNPTPPPIQPSQPPIQPTQPPIQPSPVPVLPEPGQPATNNPA